MLQGLFNFIGGIASAVGHFVQGNREKAEQAFKSACGGFVGLIAGCVTFVCTGNPALAACAGNVAQKCMCDFIGMQQNLANNVGGGQNYHNYGNLQQHQQQQQMMYQRYMMQHNQEMINGYSAISNSG